MIAHIVREAVLSDMSDIVFVLPPNKKSTLDYFKPKSALENILRKITNFLNFFDTFDRKQMNRLEFSDKNTNVFFNELLGSSLGIPSTEAEKKLKTIIYLLLKNWEVF